MFQWLQRFGRYGIRQSRPDAGVAFQVKDLKAAEGVTSSLDRGSPGRDPRSSRSSQPFCTPKMFG
jgi:hypothetical protein